MTTANEILMNEILMARKANAGNRPWLWTGDFNTIQAHIQTTADRLTCMTESLQQAQTTRKSKETTDQIW